MFDSRQVKMQSCVGFLASVAVILTAIGAFGPTGSGSGYWYGDRLYGGWVELCKSDMDHSCSTMTAAAAVAVLAFLFTLMGCITCFTPNYDNCRHARIRLIAFLLGAFWAGLSLILYPAANLDDYPFVENVAWPCDFVAFWLLSLLSALLRTHAKKSREPPPSRPIPQLSAPPPETESVEMAVMPVSLLPNMPPSQALAPAPMLLLPPGWEQGTDAQGQIYFLDHNSGTTTWTDPRLAPARYDSGPSAVAKGAVQNIPRLAAIPTASDDQIGELELAAIELSGFPAMPLCEVPNISWLSCSRVVLVFCRSCQAHSR